MKRFLGLQLGRFIFVVLFFLSGIGCLIFGQGNEKFTSLIFAVFILYAYGKQAEEDKFDQIFNNKNKLN